jgi:hypothetical protein
VDDVGKRHEARAKDAPDFISLTPAGEQESLKLDKCVRCSAVAARKTTTIWVCHFLSAPPSCLRAAHAVNWLRVSPG